MFGSFSDEKSSGVLNLKDSFLSSSKSTKQSYHSFPISLVRMSVVPLLIPMTIRASDPKLSPSTM